MIVRARDRQCLVDLALMVTGATEGVWTLALRNGVSVTGVLCEGDEIAWDSSDVVDKSVVARYDAEGICPATEVSEDDLLRLVADENEN